jgi:hypothetical protein
VRLYYRKCEEVYTGDRRGEWNLGWSVYATHGNDQKPFAVYADDGQGNGDFVAGYDTRDEAEAAVDKLVEDADNAAWGR